MAGASLTHNRLCGNIFAALREKLKNSECEVFNNDLRLKTPNGLYTYPDVMVICGEILLSETDRLDTVLNPVVIIEVLSDSTKKYDRQDKFAFYREIESLSEFILVEQKKIEVEKYTLVNSLNRKDKNSWQKEIYRKKSEIIRLKSVKIEISVAEIYANIELMKKL